MTLIVSQKQNTETCKIDNYITTKQSIDVYCLLFHRILDLYEIIVIAPDTTHIQTERLQQRTTSLIYPLRISVSGLMVQCRRILDSVVQESYSSNICKDLTSLSFPNSTNSSSFPAQITALGHALGLCLQHHSTCPFISLTVYTNSQSSLSLLNSASNLLAPNAA